MSLSAEQFQALIVGEVGDVDTVVASQITTLWTLYDGETDLYLRYLLTKRKAIDVLMGHVREQVNQQVEDASKDFSDKLKHLQTMWGNVDAEIRQVRAEAAAAAQQATTSTRQPVTGKLTATLGTTVPPLASRV